MMIAKCFPSPRLQFYVFLRSPYSSMFLISLYYHATIFVISLRKSKSDAQHSVELQWSDSYEILVMWPKSLASFNIKYMMSLIRFISVHYARLTCVVGCTDACDEDRRVHLQIDDERHVRLICITINSLNFWNIFIISCSIK